MTVGRMVAKTSGPASSDPISKITISGFKSLAQESGLEVRPLTVLAGANSSGKSSALQPLLLLKQTLEATFDPGTLLLAGPNVSFDSHEQILSRGVREFSVALECGVGRSLTNVFAVGPKGQFVNRQMTYRNGKSSLVLTRGMTATAIAELLTSIRSRSAASDRRLHWDVVRFNRCFLAPAWAIDARDAMRIIEDIGTDAFQSALESLIHVPAMRGNPERTYQVGAVELRFPGVFNRYVAGIVHHWQSSAAHSISSLGESLSQLGLAPSIEAKRIDDVRVELRVPRLVRRKRRSDLDMVSIADVGFGVSQALPVVVALIAARPGQMVFIEQPEIHLHPRAQTKLAEILATAANRGVRVVAETHSENLLLGIQTCVAEGKISPSDVRLHWFSRDKDGVTRIDTAEMDESGAFGDWPEDFADVSLSAQRRYLDAVEKLGISSK